MFEIVENVWNVFGVEERGEANVIIIIRKASKIRCIYYLLVVNELNNYVKYDNVEGGLLHV